MTGAELKDFACFEDLSEEDREVFAEAMRTLELAVGEEVFLEGDDADGMLLLVSGSLRVERREGGFQGSVGPGTVLGALSLVAPGPREASTTAETACRALWLPRTAYHRVAEDAPRAAGRFIERVLADLVAQIRPGLPLFLAGAVDPSAPAE